MARTAKPTATTVLRVAPRSKNGKAASAKVRYLCSGMEMDSKYHSCQKHESSLCSLNIVSAIIASVCNYRFGLGSALNFSCKKNSEFVFWPRCVYMPGGVQFV